MMEEDKEGFRAQQGMYEVRGLQIPPDDNSALDVNSLIVSAPVLHHSRGVETRLSAEPEGAGEWTASHAMRIDRAWITMDVAAVHHSDSAHAGKGHPAAPDIDGRMTQPRNLVHQEGARVHGLN